MGRTLGRDTDIVTTSSMITDWICNTPVGLQDQTLTDQMIVKRALITNSDDVFDDKSELKEGNCIS
jgi:hypothetical protein